MTLADAQVFGPRSRHVTTGVRVPRATAGAAQRRTGHRKAAQLRPRPGPRAAAADLKAKPPLKERGFFV